MQVAALFYQFCMVYCINVNVSKRGESSLSSLQFKKGSGITLTLVPAAAGTKRQKLSEALLLCRESSEIEQNFPTWNLPPPLTKVKIDYNTM